MRSCLLIACCVLTLSVTTSLAQDNRSDWPQFRGPTHQGVSLDTGLPTTWSATENVAWKIPMPGPGTSTPIILGSKIFLTYYTGFGVPGQGRSGSMDELKLHVLCLNRDDGSVRWTREVLPKLPEQASIREAHGYASSTPAADAERVYVFFGKSGVYAFDHDGNPKWQADVGSKLNGWGSATALLLHGDHVIVNASVESESLVALDRKTGKEVWRTPGIRESWNMPVPVKLSNGETELVVAIMGKIFGIDPKTGERLWSCNTDIGWYMVPSVVVEDGIIYVVGGRSGGGLAVRAGGRGDVTKTHRLWTIRKGSNVTSPIVHQGHLYWMHEALGIAYCAELKTGRIVYEERIPGADQVYASPVLAGGNLYYLTRTGKAFIVAAQPKFQLVATNNFSERTTFNASPAVADGRLYVRSDRTLYCLGRK